VRRQSLERRSVANRRERQAARVVNRRVVPVVVCEHVDERLDRAGVRDAAQRLGGGANRTSQRRVGIAMNYCAGYLRQQENQQLGIPLEIARTFEPRLRKLAGFGLYRRLIGHIDKCSPEDLLDGSPPRPIVGTGA
jgi:hypothetical protein